MSFHGPLQQRIIHKRFCMGPRLSVSSVVVFFHIRLRTNQSYALDDRISCGHGKGHHVPAHPLFPAFRHSVDGRMCPSSAFPYPGPQSGPSRPHGGDRLLRMRDMLWLEAKLVAAGSAGVYFRTKQRKTQRGRHHRLRHSGSARHPRRRHPVFSHGHHHVHPRLRLGQSRRPGRSHQRKQTRPVFRLTPGGAGMGPPAVGGEGVAVAVGHWSSAGPERSRRVVIGHWSLVIGHWSLVIGH